MRHRHALPCMYSTTESSPVFAEVLRLDVLFAAGTVNQGRGIVVPFTPALRGQSGRVPRRGPNRSRLTQLRILADIEAAGFNPVPPLDAA